MKKKVVTEHRCPSGLRSRTQDAMWQHARVRIPLCAFFINMIYFILCNHSIESISSFVRSSSGVFTRIFRRHPILVSNAKTKTMSIS